MSTTPEFSEAQLASARATAWHQAGEPVSTLEAARDWVSNYGLILFAPHAQTLGAPAPSLVEATLGEANTAPTAAQTEVALGLLARMVAEGSAVPLNLLGGPGDVPDFIASAQVFSFCYTLRGDKAWKQAPAQTGAVKVSPLSLRIYEVLGERGTLTAEALASELGREVNSSAVMRALGELWSQMRVLPRRENGGTGWELATARFTKAIKAGSNAGLPKALSALVSLYLHQSISASEAEVEGFLSPLTARSRVREVVHALTSARELETVVIDGKTMLYVADALPEFAAIVEPQADEAAAEPEQLTAERQSDEASGAHRNAADAGTGGAEGRISRFKSAGPRGGDLRGKPFRSSPGRKTASGAFGRGDRSRPAAGGRGGFEKPVRPRSTSEGAAADRSERPAAFTRPWDEERQSRGASTGGEDRPKRPFRPRAEGDAPRPARPFRPRAEGEAPRPFRPRAEGDAPRPARPFRERADRGPARNQGGGESRPAAFRRERPERTERSEGEAGGGARDRGPRPPQSREAGASPYARSDRGAGPERRSFSGDRAGRSDRPKGGAERRPFRPRSPEGEDTRGADRRAPRTGESRAARPAWTSRDDKPARPRADGERPAFRSTRPSFAAKGRPERAGFDRPARSAPSERGGAGEGAERPRAPKRFGSAGSPRPFGDRPAGRPEGTRPRPRPDGSRATEERPGARPGARPAARGGSARPAGARPGGFGARGARPAAGGFGARGARPSGGGFGSRGTRPPVSRPAGGPKRGGTGAPRDARPRRRPDEPAGEA